MGLICTYVSIGKRFYRYLLCSVHILSNHCFSIAVALKNDKSQPLYRSEFFELKLDRFRHATSLEHITNARDFCVFCVLKI